MNKEILFPFFSLYVKGFFYLPSFSVNEEILLHFLSNKKEILLPSFLLC